MKTHQSNMDLNLGYLDKLKSADQASLGTDFTESVMSRLDEERPNANSAIGIRAIAVIAVILAVNILGGIAYFNAGTDPASVEDNDTIESFSESYFSGNADYEY